MRAAVAAGARGIVATGLGAGFAPAAERAALVEADEAGVAVCLARRTTHGRTVGAVDTAPFLSAGALTALQARLVLSVGLADGPTPGTRSLQDLLDGCGA
ncbi:hypothetical protein GCM10023350_12940 [Nocardioides endophyticus]|uniref:Asparaginase/glutaminase C-terminal domain-containing protein n=1 Tax=Nocardioides endophyticus TaxID=1353775 RepID=A0ABP8YIB2_9ACTN